MILRWLGFDHASIDVAHAERYAGESAYTLGTLIRFAMDGLFFQSTTLLRWSTYIGFAASLVRRPARRRSSSSATSSGRPIRMDEPDGSDPPDRRVDDHDGRGGGAVHREDLHAGEGPPPLRRRRCRPGAARGSKTSAHPSRSSSQRWSTAIVLRLRSPSDSYRRWAATLPVCVTTLTSAAARARDGLTDEGAAEALAARGGVDVDELDTGDVILLSGADEPGAWVRDCDDPFVQAAVEPDSYMSRTRSTGIRGSRAKRLSLASSRACGKRTSRSASSRAGWAARRPRSSRSRPSSSTRRSTSRAPCEWRPRSSSSRRHRRTDRGTPPRPARLPRPPRSARRRGAGLRTTRTPKNVESHERGSAVMAIPGAAYPRRRGRRARRRSPAFSLHARDAARSSSRASGPAPAAAQWPRATIPAHARRLRRRPRLRRGALRHARCPRADEFLVPGTKQAHPVGARSLVSGQPARFLEVGCGTGYVLAAILAARPGPGGGRRRAVPGGAPRRPHAARGRAAGSDGRAIPRDRGSIRRRRRIRRSRARRPRRGCSAGACSRRCGRVGADRHRSAAPLALERGRRLRRPRAEVHAPRAHATRCSPPASRSCGRPRS